MVGFNFSTRIGHHFFFVGFKSNLYVINLGLSPREILIISLSAILSRKDIPNTSNNKR